MPKKILLADDSITIQKVVELTFSDGDYEVIATSNGAKAIQRLADVRPDIILSDIIMPEKNGYEVCEYVKSSPEFRHIPVILLTGTFEPFDPDRAEKAGCDAVVTKPFESQSLIHKVEELIAQSQQGAAVAEEPPPAVEEPSPFAAAVPAAFEAFGTTPPPPAAEEPAAPSWSSYAQEEPSPFAATGEAAPSWGSEAPAVDAPFTEPPSFEEPAQPFAEEPRAAYESEPMFEEPAQAFGGEEPSFQESEQAFGSEPSIAAPEPAFGGEPSFPEAEQTFEEPELETSLPDAAPEEETYKVHGDELFEAASRTSEEQSLSFEGAEGGDVATTRAFPKLDFASLSGTERDVLPPVDEKREDAFSFDRPEPATTGFPSFEEPEVSPTDETATRSPDFGYESTTEPAGAFGEPEAELPEAELEEPSAPSAELGAADFDEPVSAETKMLPRLTFEDMQRFREEAAAEKQAETPAWEPPAPLEFPRVPQSESEAPAPLSFDEPQGETFESADEAAPFTVGHTIEAPSPWTPPSEEPEEQAAASPWEDEPVATEPEPPVLETEASAFGTEEETPFEPEQEEAAAPSTGEALPFAAPPAAEEQEVAWSEESAAAAEENVAEFPRQEEPVAAITGTATAAAFSGDLTEEQVERIARRVVELMSERMVKDIAWEVIPDLAEIVVRERIRQLETES